MKTKLFLLAIIFMVSCMPVVTEEKISAVDSVLTLDSAMASMKMDTSLVVKADSVKK